MINFILVIGLFIQPFQDIPYKPDNEFEIRLDMKFKSRPTAEINKLDFVETTAEREKRMDAGSLPYVSLFVNIKEVNQGEVRMKIYQDGKSTSVNRKVELDKEFKIEIGYSDDAKDKISGYEYIINFLSIDKMEINKIVITIESNGDYLVNGQKRGRI